MGVFTKKYKRGLGGVDASFQCGASQGVSVSPTANLCRPCPITSECLRRGFESFTMLSRTCYLYCQGFVGRLYRKYYLVQIALD